MKSSLHALWLLFCPTPPPAVPKPSWRNTFNRFSPHFFSFAFFIVFSVVVLSILGNSYRQATQPPSSEAVEALRFSGSTLNQIRDVRLYAQSSALRDGPPRDFPAPVAFAGPEEFVSLLRAAIADTKLKQVSEDCLGCVVLQWHANRGWHATYRPSPTASTPVSENEAILMVSRAVKDGLLEKSGIGAPVLDLDPEQTIPAMMNLMATTLVAISNILVLAVAWLLAISLGLRGYQWDMWRSSGKLEPWGLTQHPPWVIYGSQLARQSVTCVVIFGLFLGLAWILGVPLRWPWVLSLWALLPFMCLVIGLWGMLATILFHHSKGRMFARFLLSPIVIGMVWSFRLVIVFVGMRWSSPILAWEKVDQLNTQWPILLWGIPVLSIIALVLMWCVNARVGVRREGLRRTA